MYCLYLNVYFVTIKSQIAMAIHSAARFIVSRLDF